LPQPVRALADKQFELLKSDPRHPSLHFKRVARFPSVRVGAHHRALAVDATDGVLWFWMAAMQTTIASSPTMRLTLPAPRAHRRRFTFGRPVR